MLSRDGWCMATLCQVAWSQIEHRQNNTLNQLDIHSNRAASKYSKRSLALRIVWETIFRPVCSLTPRPLHGLRCALLRALGATIASNVHIYPTAKIQFPWNLKIGEYSAIGDNARIYNLGQLTIGDRVTISQHSHLCGGSHDYESSTMDLIKAPITILDDVWICADAFVGPGVTIGRGAVVGARAVVTKDIEPYAVVAGNPARVIKYRSLGENPEPLRSI